MSKKAFLVATTFMTRVVVDEDLENDENYEALVSKVEENLKERIANGETCENIEDVFEDEECPYKEGE